jgi:hypothetical protein
MAIHGGRVAMMMDLFLSCTKQISLQGNGDKDPAR